MNVITLNHGFVEVWNNGNRITTIAVSIYGLEEAVRMAREYIRQWAGDDNPIIDIEED